jgi:hypothetical protein
MKHRQLYAFCKTAARVEEDAKLRAGRDQRHNHDGKIGIRNPLIRAELTITVNTD